MTPLSANAFTKSSSERSWSREYQSIQIFEIGFNLFGFNETHKRVTNYDMNWVGQLAIFMNEDPDFVEEIIGSHF